MEDFNPLKQQTPDEHIALLLSVEPGGFFDPIDGLIQYELDLLIPHFKVVSETFIKPKEWVEKSENEKVLIVMNWLRGQVNRNIDITFRPDERVEYTLKYFVVGCFMYLEEIRLCHI